MWSIIQAAGWPIWPLIFASVIALALIFERLWSLRQSVVAPAGMVDKVLAEYRRTGADAGAPRPGPPHQGPLGRVLAAGLANVKSPRPVMKEAIEEVGRVVSARARALPDHARHDRRDGAAARPVRHGRRHDRDLRLADRRRHPTRSSSRTASRSRCTTPRSA